MGTREWCSSCWGGGISTLISQYDSRTPLSYTAGNGQVGVVQLLLERGISAPTGQTLRMEHHSCMLPRMGTREWYGYYWGGEMSIPKGEILGTEHRSGMLRLRGIRES